MSERYDCMSVERRGIGIAAAVAAAGAGDLIVLPTDTVYGVGADAFDPGAVKALLASKGRGRDMPPPVLVGSARAAAALVEEPGPYWQDLVDEFWPGALTLVCRASRTVQWDLGETRGTVAVRMPLHPVALELLNEFGPLAVSSANLTGHPAPQDCDSAQNMLGDSVSVYLDGGRTPDPEPSSIVDVTGKTPVLLRVGALSAEELRKVVPDLEVGS